MTVRSLTHKENLALNLIRNAFSQGLDDDECIDFATAAMGEEMRPLIGRVHARHFKAYGPN